MQMLYLHLRVFRPLLEFFGRRLFEKKSDEAVFFEQGLRVICKVVLPVRPDNLINSKFNEVINESVK